MKKGLVIGTMAIAAVVVVGVASSGTKAGAPDPKPGVKPKGGVLGGAGGFKASSKATPPPAAAFSWSADCKPTVTDEVKMHMWAESLGRAQAKGQSVKTLLDTAARAAMGPCWPPPADITVWKPFFGFMYRSTRAYLRGLVYAGNLGADAAQQLLTDGRKDLISRGADEAELPPFLYDTT